MEVVAAHQIDGVLLGIGQPLLEGQVEVLDGDLYRLRPQSLPKPPVQGGRGDDADHQAVQLAQVLHWPAGGEHPAGGWQHPQDEGVARLLADQIPQGLTWAQSLAHLIGSAAGESGEPGGDGGDIAGAGPDAHVHRPVLKVPPPVVQIAQGVFRVDLDLELALGGLLHLLLQELGSLIGEAARGRGVGQDQTAGLWLSGRSAGCGGEAVKEIGPLSPAGTAGQYGKTQYSRH